MADNDTSSEQAGVTPPSDPGAMPNNAPNGETPQESTLSLEAAMKRIAELEHAHKNAREQADRQAKKLTQYEKAEQDKRDAELSEIERIKKQNTELQSQHEAYTKAMQERIVSYEVQAQAAKLGIIDPEAASKLMDWSQLEFDESGTPTNADKVLEKLIKSKPYLAPPKQEPPATTPASKQIPAIPAMNPGRSQITPADSLPPGPMSIAAAYAAVRNSTK